MPDSARCDERRNLGPTLERLRYADLPGADVRPVHDRATIRTVKCKYRAARCVLGAPRQAVLSVESHARQKVSDVAWSLSLVSGTPHGLSAAARCCGKIAACILSDSSLGARIWHGRCKAYFVSLRRTAAYHADLCLSELSIVPRALRALGRSTRGRTWRLLAG